MDVSLPSGWVVDSRSDHSLACSHVNHALQLTYDFAPPCTEQMCQVSDMGWYQYKKDLTVFGISTDGPYSHMEFAEENDLDYPLLCDTGGQVLDEYGVLMDEWEGMRSVPRRSVFLIDRDRTVRYRWVAEDNLADDDFGLNPVQEAIRELG